MKVDVFEQLDQVLGLSDHQPRGIVTDVDGTISEIAPSPDAALASAAMKQHLHTLTKHLDLVGAISGRSGEDVRRLVGVDGLVYYGNHGLEWWADGRGRFSQGVEPYVTSYAVHWTRSEAI